VELSQHAKAMMSNTLLICRSNYGTLACSFCSAEQNVCAHMYTLVSNGRVERVRQWDKIFVPCCCRVNAANTAFHQIKRFLRKPLKAIAFDFAHHCTKYADKQRKPQKLLKRFDHLRNHRTVQDGSQARDHSSRGIGL